MKSSALPNPSDSPTELTQCVSNYVCGAVCICFGLDLLSVTLLNLASNSSSLLSFPYYCLDQVGLTFLPFAWLFLAQLSLPLLGLLSDTRKSAQLSLAGHWFTFAFLAWLS